MNPLKDLKGEKLIEKIKDNSLALQGKLIYENNCVVCHLGNGQGKAGPNLTDKYWLNGNSPLDIYDSIANGIGVMPGFLSVLDHKEIIFVTAYINSIKNTNVPGKKPEGKKYE